jgi:formylglycine-generating enzyme required for sulfatase activity
LPFIRLVRIPAGSFLMGSTDTERGRNPDEGPVHQVTIGYDFYLGETEVTQGQWEAVMGYNAATHSPEGTPWPNTYGVGRDYPVYYVSWDDCQAFRTALNALGQGTFRLPSEAEWEYACRAQTLTRFSFGDSLGCADGCENCDAAKGFISVAQRSDFMWYCANSGPSSQPVRQRFANGFGLYDMHGNLVEWCQDSHHADYTGAPNDGSVWEFPVGSSPVIRGGGWMSSAQNCRAAVRYRGDPTARVPFLGFRVVRTP